jgi:septal ring factor EnvC (AmiA/AmiB activator)
LPKTKPRGMMGDAMKKQIGVVALVVVALGLVIGMIAVSHHAAERENKDADRILTLSNEWRNTSDQLDRQKQVNTMLEGDLATERKAMGELTNDYARVSADLARASSDLTNTAAILKTSQEEVTRLNGKITDLETQNQQLDKQAGDLTTALTNVTVQITETQRKLAVSEGDKAFLEKELKRLMAEQEELKRQFNDLAVLRAQVSKLKEELSISRRLEWIRQGLFANADQKGAQKLMQGFPVAQTPAKAAAPSKQAYDLNVEISADGTVKVIPPLTNAPVSSPPPGK